MTGLSPIQPLLPTPEAFRASDGAEITVWKWPEKPGRPVLHWCHATGFHARTYTPLLNALSEHLNVVAWDMRGHGDSHAAGKLESFYGWETYYDDLVSWIALQKTPVILAGHSVGATTSLVAACRTPEQVAGVLLCDPVLIGGWPAAMLGLTKVFAQAHRLKLAAGALSRRPVFDSLEAAFDSYRSKAGFRCWPDEWLQAYVDGGFITVSNTPQATTTQTASDDEQSVQLACTPAWESRTFSTTEHRVWGKLRSIPLTVEVLAAEKGSTFPREQRPRLGRVLPNVSIRELVGCSHFLPMEQPEAVYAAAMELVGKIAR